MKLFRREKPKISPELDADVEKKIKKHPKKIQKHLRMLYAEYKKGNLLFPEGFDKEKILEKK